MEIGWLHLKFMPKWHIYFFLLQIVSFKIFTLIPKTPYRLNHWFIFSCVSRWLTFEDNNLHTVPENFDKLQSLVHLNFNRNNFNYIPFKISKIKTLKYLHMQNNEFFTVPEKTVFAMPHTKINLQHNPLQLQDDKVTTFPFLWGQKNLLIANFLGIYWVFLFSDIY